MRLSLSSGCKGERVWRAVFRRREGECKSGVNGASRQHAVSPMTKHRRWSLQNIGHRILIVANFFSSKGRATACQRSGQSGLRTLVALLKNVRARVSALWGTTTTADLHQYCLFYLFTRKTQVLHNFKPTFACSIKINARIGGAYRFTGYSCWDWLLTFCVTNTNIRHSALQSRSKSSQFYTCKGK